MPKTTRRTTIGILMLVFSSIGLADAAGNLYGAATASEAAAHDLTTQELAKLLLLFLDGSGNQRSELSKSIQVNFSS